MGPTWMLEDKEKGNQTNRNRKENEVLSTNDFCRFSLFCCLKMLEIKQHRGYRLLLEACSAEE